MLQKQVISTGSLSLNHYFLCTYLPITDGKDELSKSLLRFKSRLQVDLQAWVECGTHELSSLKIENFILLRALHTGETVATLSGLDILGVQLAKKWGCDYHPNWLKKTRYTRPLKSLRKAERSHELKDVYQFIPDKIVNEKQFLIVDDILTTGTTALAIAQAILEVNVHANVIVFTLAKVDYDTQLNESLSFSNDMYHWEKKNGWEVNEEEQEYNRLQTLKNKIMRDSF